MLARNALGRPLGTLSVATTALGAAYTLVGPTVKLADKMEQGELHNGTIEQQAAAKAAGDAKRVLPKWLQRSEPLYPGHVPLFGYERALMFAGSAIGALLHPEDNRHIVALGESTAREGFLRGLRDKMLASPVGRRILREKPYITSESLHMDALRKYPTNSFGRVYCDWMVANGVSADTRVDVRYIDDVELAFVFQRYRQSHDFVHALANLPVWREGEIAVKAFEYLNMGVPFAGMGALFSPWTVKKKAERERLFNIYYPWALECSANMERKGVCLMNVMWEDVLVRDVDELRQELGICVPPNMRELRKKGITK